VATLEAADLGVRLRTADERAGEHPVAQLPRLVAVGTDAQTGDLGLPASLELQGEGAIAEHGQLDRQTSRGGLRRDRRRRHRADGVGGGLQLVRLGAEDLPDLVWYFVNLYSRQVCRQITALSPEMMDLFSKYHWPGNIRQLRNVVRTALVLGYGPTLSVADATWLFNELQPRPQKTDISTNGDDDTVIFNLSGLPLAHVERRAILDTLEQTSGNQTRAAKILGISDRTLRGKIRQYRQQDCLQTV